MKKGQGALVGLMIFAMLFIAAIAMIPAIKEQTAQGRTELNCASDDLSAGEQGTCIINDWYMFIFFGVSVAMGAGYLTGRKLGYFGGGQ